MKQFNIVDSLKTSVKLLDNIEDYIDTLSAEQSECDSRLSDLYHFVENNNMSASQSCSLIKEMKRVLLERRKIKNDRELGNLLKNEIQRLNNKNTRQMLITDICKKAKQLDTKYKNRIYADNDFIDLKIQRGQK